MATHSIMTKNVTKMNIKIGNKNKMYFIIDTTITPG